MATSKKTLPSLHDELIDRANILLELGLHVVPIRRDGSKAPDMPAGYVDQYLGCTDKKAIGKLRAGSVDGIGVVCNSRSMHQHDGTSYILTALELEGRAVNDEFLSEWATAAAHIGATDLLSRLDRGWVEDTPSGGLRWFFRLPASSRELADEVLRLVPRTAAQRYGSEGAQDTFAELLVSKHQVVVAPSGGRTHSNGRDWATRGSASKIEVLSTAELFMLSDLLAQVDEVGAERTGSAVSPLDQASGRVRQVATDFNRRATSEGVVELLCVHGWRLTHTDPDGTVCVELANSPGHGQVKVGGPHLPPGGVFTFSTSAGRIPAERYVSPFEVAAILDPGDGATRSAANGDLDSYAEHLLATGAARITPWGLMPKRRINVEPSATNTDVLVMQINRALGDARSPKADAPFVLAHVTPSGAYAGLVSPDREGGLRRWTPRDASLLLSVVQPIRTGKDNVTKLHELPSAVVNMVLPDGEPPAGVAAVQYVSDAPVLLPSGHALSSPGLHRQHRALVAIPLRARRRWSGYRVPETPTAEDAQRACDYLVEEMLSDFPFETTADLARAVALLLTAATRQMYGAAPMFALDAADRGTGKSLLAALARYIGTGSTAAQSVSPLRADDAETGKAIVSAVLNGTLALHIDELPRGQHITSRTLSEIVTSDGSMALRVLGTNRSIAIPPTLCTVCGNNIEAGADMQRRIFPVRMVHRGTQLAFERAGFRHPDLPVWVREHRPELLAALHTMAAYGIQEVPTDLPAIGSFEAWTRVVLAALRLVTITGQVGSDLVMDGRREFIDAQDIEGDDWLPIMQAWASAFGTGVRVGARQAFDTLSAVKPVVDLPSELLPQPGQSSSGAAKSWGRSLLRRRDTAVRNGEVIYRLRCNPDSKRGNSYVLDVEGTPEPTPDQPAHVDASVTDSVAEHATPPGGHAASSGSVVASSDGDDLELAG